MTEIQQWQPRNEIATAQDVAVQRLGEWAHSAQAAYQVATNLVQTSFVPEAFRNKPHEATAAILSGLEVGLSPMAALRSFDVIQGSAAARALTLRAIVQSHGHEIEVVESTTTRCVMRGRRKGSTDWQRVTWTIDRAKQLGLIGKPNWKNQPQTMLVARATSEISRLVAADAILGIGYSSEELADGAGESTPMVDGPTETPAGARRMSRKPKPPNHVEETVEQTGPEPLDTRSDLAKAMFASFNEAGVTERDDRLAYVSRVVGREVASSGDMTEADARQVLDSLTADAEALRTGSEEPADAEDFDPSAEDPSWGQS